MITDRDREKCASKKRYPSKQHARMDARRLARTYGHGGIYACAVCGHWHVTKQDKEAVRATFRAREQPAIIIEDTSRFRAREREPGLTTEDLQFFMAVMSFAQGSCSS